MEIEREALRVAAQIPLAVKATVAEHEDLPSRSSVSTLRGKRVAMVLFSIYPEDTRPRRAINALLEEGMSVDLICLARGNAPAREALGELNVLRLPITHRRDSRFAYVYNYSMFILMSAGILAWRSIVRRYDLVYVHNMPDILVLSSLVPKLLGAKVILDLHDPMPELMTTIFNLDKNSLVVRFVQGLEKWSIARANLVLTVSSTFKRVFTSRSCPPEKMGVVMNSPDDQIFPFRRPRSYPLKRNVPSKRLVVMFHGSLVERNGVDLAIDAVARVRNTVPAIELRIYGFRTPFLEEVMEAAHVKGLEDCVHYLGPRTLEELVGEIEGCDVGVVPNHRNAFTDINTPTRIFEYLALGKPTIAPRTSGVQEYFDPGSLVFFESGNAEDLARKIEYVASHYEEAMEITERGQAIYLMHTWSRERRALVNWVRRLLAGRQTEAVPAIRG